MRYDVIVFATLDGELIELTGALARVVSDGPFALWGGRLAGTDLLVVRTGIGARVAREAAERVFSRASAAMALSVGTCGALEAELAPAELVVARAVVDAGSGESFAADAAPTELLERVTSAVRRRVGTLATASERWTGPDEKRALARRTGAIAVDLESAAIARASRAAGVPFGAMRAVLDLVGETLPSHPDGPLLDDEGRPQWTRLLALAARDPMLPIGLARLWRRERAARMALGAAVRAACERAMRAA